MAKNSSKDSPQPEEGALEQHVREMMDVNIPDPPATPEPTPEQPKKPVTIKVIDHTDVPTQTEPKPKPKQAEPSLDDAISATNEQLAAQTTAPLVPEGKPKKTTKVAITHFDEEDEVPIQPASSDTPELTTDEAPVVEETTPTDQEPAKTVQDAIDEAGGVLGEDVSSLEPEIESAATERAVNEIVAQESDELLAANDAKLPSVKPPRKKGRISRFFSAWAHSSAARWATFLVIFVSLVAVGAFPESRYWILNKAGVKSTASVVVTDASTLRPLKNVTVSLAGQSVQTDAEGKAQLQQLPLGPSEVVVSKRAFAEERKRVTVGWGSNPLGEIALRPVGNQYVFSVTDVFSGKPIPGAEVVAGEASASSDDKGKATLTLEQTDADTLDVTIKAEGYRDESVVLNLDNKQETPISLTPNHKVAFVSKRSGTYDVYTIDADTKNEKLVLAGTGKEASEIAFAQHPTADQAVLVSTRDGKRAADGSLLNSLLFINTTDGSTKSVIESPQIRLVGWVGTRLIYVQMVTEASAEDPQRYKLMSYDYVSGDNRQLASANYFNDVIIAGSKVYYAPASAYQNGVNVGVFVVEAAGGGKQPIFDQESWNMYRTSYDHIALAVQQDWYDFVVGASKPDKLGGQPSSTASRVYVDSPDGKKSVWVDSRDGKGTLVVYDTATKTEKVLYAQAGIKGPARWLNNTTLVYRSAEGETADYVISTQGGEPKKVSDVTDTISIDNWSY